MSNIVIVSVPIRFRQMFKIGPKRIVENKSFAL